MSLTVTIYTRENCPLCDKAKAAILASGVGVPSLVEVDIDEDPELQAKYTNDVPVVLVDGIEVFRHRVEPHEFAAYVGGKRVMSLASEKCVPCRGGVPPLKGDELRKVERELGGGWQIIDEHHLRKEFPFPDFATALAFTNRIGAVAEEEGHHPDIHLAWGKVGVEIWTHKIDGLTRSDFVLAAKIDALS